MDSYSFRNWPPEIYHLLYEDEAGRVVGLDEVQLLDPVPAERLAPTRALLQSEDLFLVYQAALVLTAWGDPTGLNQIEALIEARVDQRMEFAPHRIHDYDNLYDEMAQAVDRYELSSEAQQEDRPRIFRKLLGLYGPCDFESALKSALLRMGRTPELLPEMHAALERSLSAGKVYLASQMLPPLAKWEGEAVRPLLDRFSALTSGRQSDTPDPRLNITEAQALLPAVLGCIHCRQGVHSASWPPPDRIAINGDGPEYLHLCAHCGTYWLFDMRAAVTVPEAMARRHFPAHFAGWSPMIPAETLPQILMGDDFPPADFSLFRDAPPEGALEQALVDAKAGRRSRASLLPLLRASLLHVPSSTKPATDGSGMTPLALNRPPVVWVLTWTRLDLARRFADDAPDCLIFHASDLIARLPSGFGLSLNFGAESECQIGPADLSAPGD